MRLFLSVTLLMVMGMGALGLRADCSPGSTVVLVTDCSGAPVHGAHINIKVCCANNQQVQRSSVSASNGEATFDINAKEICDGTVKFAGFSATSFGTGSCTAPGKEGKSRCAVQVCKRQ
jgi:hypothetical protein